MIPKESITQSFLVQNFKFTYQGTTTDQISFAYVNLKKASFDHYGIFLKLCEQLLEKYSFNDKNICLSIANFIQKLTQTFIQQRILDPLGPKLFYTSLQHLFDNQKINPKFKLQLAWSYIKMANYFSQNYERIAGKIKFYYDTNKFIEALTLSRAYVQEPTFKNKAKSYFYNYSFPVLLLKTCQTINKYVNKEENQKVEMMWILQQFIETIHGCLQNVIFQKYESALFPLFQNQQILFVLQSINIFNHNLKIQTLLKQIMSEIISNLGRIRLLQKYQRLNLMIKKFTEQEWNQFTMKLKNKKLSFQSDEIYTNQVKHLQLVDLKLFSLAFQYNVIVWIPQKSQLFQIFLVALYQVTSKILVSDEDNSQKLNLLQDSIYWMKSQCVQVLFLKLLKIILLKKQDTLNKLISLIYQNLFNSNEQFKTNLIKMEDTISIYDYLLNFIIFQVHILMRNQTFLQNLQRFFIANLQAELTKRQNSHIYYLLIYKNYMDQIFFRYESIYISTTFLKQYLCARKEQLNLNIILTKRQEFQLVLLKEALVEHFRAGFQQKDIQNEIECVTQFFIDQFDAFSLSILNEVILKYQFEDKIILSILDKTFSETLNQIQQWKQANNRQNKKMNQYNQKIKSAFQLLQNFFKVDHWKSLFQYVLSRTVDLIKSVDKQHYMDNLIQITKNAINYLKYIPKGFIEVVIDLFDLRSIKSFHSFQALTVILKYSRKQDPKTVCISQSKYQNQILINSLLIKLIQILKKCSFSDYSMDTLLSKLSLTGKSSKPPKYYKRQIPALMVIHQVIYYHGYAITQKTIQNLIQTTKQILQQKIQEFNHVNGKYLLTMFFLLRYRFNTTMAICQRLNIIQWVFEHIYKCQNQYRIQYDIPLLVSLQIFIRTNYLRNQWIMKYLNVSFLCLFYNIDRVFIIKKNPINFDSESDEELQPQKPYKLQLMDINKIVQKMYVPDEFKNISELVIYSSFIEQLFKNERTKEWVKIIIEKGLSSQQKKHFRQIIKLQNIQGKLRSIKSIKKHS